MTNFLNLDAKQTKSYATEFSARCAADKAIGQMIDEKTRQFIQVIIVGQDGRFFPIFHLMNSDAMYYAMAFASAKFYVFN